jgi:type IV pilus assembly protein PilE
MCRPADEARRAAAGFSLIELVITLAVLGVLATIALPSLMQQIRKTRRADAIAAVQLLQQAQERYRATQPQYASGLGSDGLNLPATSPSGHYLLSSAAASGAEATSYDVRAQAQGPQELDLACRFMVLRVNGGQLGYASGADAEASNLGTANRDCWGQR